MVTQKASVIIENFLDTFLFVCFVFHIIIRHQHKHKEYISKNLAQFFLFLFFMVILSVSLSQINCAVLFL